MKGKIFRALLSVFALAFVYKNFLRQLEFFHLLVLCLL